MATMNPELTSSDAPENKPSEMEIDSTVAGEEVNSNSKSTGNSFSEETTDLQKDQDLDNLPIVNTTPEEAASNAEAVLEAMKKKSTILFANYTALCRKAPDSPESSRASEAYYQFLEKLTRFQQAHNSHKMSTGSPVAISTMPTIRAVVPPGLPKLQLKGENIWKKDEEAFDSAHDFCVSFEKVFRAHLQDFNLNWERLLPMCMNTEQMSWFEEVLVGRNLAWSEAKARILDCFDTPYRKFLLMVEVGSLKQDRYETNREYESRYQKLRREAGIEDGTQLAVSFFVSLRESVRAHSQVAIASHFSTNLPTSINQIIDLVVASGEDSSFAAPPVKRPRHKGPHESYKNSSRNTNKGHIKPNKVLDSSTSRNLALSNKPCTFCNKPWIKGHRCQEFVDAKKANKQNNNDKISNNKNNKINRMARRSIQNDNDEDDNIVQLNRMSLN